MNEASMLTPQYAQYTGEPVKVKPVLSVSGLCIEYTQYRFFHCAGRSVRFDR